MILIRRYKVRKAGSRGYLVSLPNEYIEGAKIHPGQKLAMYRCGDNLFLVPEPQSGEGCQPETSQEVER